MLYLLMNEYGEALYTNVKSCSKTPPQLCKPSKTAKRVQSWRYVIKTLKSPFKK